MEKINKFNMMTWYFTENWKAYTFILAVPLWESIVLFIAIYTSQTRNKMKFNHNKCLDPGTS